jgi:endo-1,4-beta-xylanase
MKPLYIKSLILLSVIITTTTALAQIPEGGLQLNATTGNTYQKIGVGTLTTVTVSDQTFTTALRLTVGANINNAWDSQIKFTPVAGIETGDVILVAFWARTIEAQIETGEGGLNVVIEHNTTYAKELYHKVNISTEWKQYFTPVKVNSTWTTSQVTYSFHTGFPNQTIEFADVRFLNYKQTLTFEDMPQTLITYAGQAPDAPWRAPAQERINQIRKGIADIIVYDENGQVVEDAEVTIEMIRHQFGFGSAIPAARFLSNETFRQKVYELFNEVVFENDLKWPGFNTTSKSNVSKSLDSLDKHNIAVRGHNIIWPAWRWLPTSLRTYEKDPVGLRAEIDKHIEEKATFTRGRLNDWDVINEPYTEKDLMNILGNEIMAEWFKQVRNIDRGVKLYLNDYGILSGGGINKAKQDYYFNLIKYIEDLGGEVDGIGFQGHFGGDLTPVSKLYEIVDRFAAYGKDIKITEHDINITQRDVQAEYTRDFMTMMFSHEAVKSVMFWGFWESSHWMPQAALYNADWSIRPHGQMYKDLVFDQWWTKQEDAVTDGEGKASLEGFLGTYRYTLKSGATERTGTFTLDHSIKSGLGNTIILSLESELPAQITLTSDKPGILCEGETLTLSATASSALQYKWYHNDELMDVQTASVVTGKAGTYRVVAYVGDIEFTAPAFEVKVNPLPASVIEVTGELAFCPGGKVKLSVANPSVDHYYTWHKETTKIDGSVKTIDVNQSGSYTLTANSSGCIAKSEPVNVTVYGAADPNCTTGIDRMNEMFRVYPNPFKGSFVLESEGMFSGPMKIELFNAAGMPVYNTTLLPSQSKITIPVGAPGVYNLKVSGTDGVKTFKIIGINF